MTLSMMILKIFLISTDDTELMTGDSHDYIGNDVTIVPTTNAGETAFII